MVQGRGVPREKGNECCTWGGGEGGELSKVRQLLYRRAHSNAMSSSYAYPYQAMMAWPAFHD